MAATFLFIDFVRSQHQQTKEQIKGYQIRWCRVRNSSFSLCYCGTKCLDKNGCNFFIHQFCTLATSANERTNQGLSIKVVPSAKFVFFVMLLWNKRFGQKWLQLFYSSILFARNISKRKNKSRAIDKGGSECEIRLFRYVTVEQKVWTKMAATFLFIDFVRS